MIFLEILKKVDFFEKIFGMKYDENRSDLWFLVVYSEGNIGKTWNYDENLIFNIFFWKLFKKMRNIILSNLDQVWDFYLNGEGRKWQFYDFIKIGKNRKNLIWDRPRRVAERKEFRKDS